MTVTEINNNEYELFKKEGGNAVFIIDVADISANKEFESYPSLKDKLKTGFELPPTSMIHASDLIAQIMLYGSEWTKILASVYICGGKVIYKKIENEKYEAHCSVPKKA